MPLTTSYTCTRCREEFDFDHIKYDSNNKLICVECLAKQEKIEKKEKLSFEKAEEGEPVNFICVACRFKFSVSKGSPKAVKCPYCGKTRLMLVKKYKDENDLIQDSMDPRFDY